MNPIEEAKGRLDNEYDVMVLEPSPPALMHEPFSDDPTAPTEPRPADTPRERPLVAPVETGIAGHLTWDELARDDPDLASWCAHRALGAWPPPPRLPGAAALERTRLSLHALAEHVVCAARHRVNGKIGLRFTRGGFGTPFFGTDEQVRIEGATLVYTAFTPARETRTEVSTLGAAASAVGIEAGAPDLFTPTTPLDLDRPLELESAALAVFGWWFGFGAAVLAQVRADPDSNAAPSPPSLLQIWPEHFDLAVDLGDTATGARANYGASPGDATHPEPYLYVGPWDQSRLPPRPDPDASVAGDTPDSAPDPYWNESFGASLPYSVLIAAPNAREAALAFFRTGRARLLA